MSEDVEERCFFLPGFTRSVLLRYGLSFVFFVVLVIAAGTRYAPEYYGTPLAYVFWLIQLVYYSVRLDHVGKSTVMSVLVMLLHPVAFCGAHLVFLIFFIVLFGYQRDVVHVIAPSLGDAPAWLVAILTHVLPAILIDIEGFVSKTPLRAAFNVLGAIWHQTDTPMVDIDEARPNAAIAGDTPMARNQRRRALTDNATQRSALRLQIAYGSYAWLCPLAVWCLTMLGGSLETVYVITGPSLAYTPLLYACVVVAGIVLAVVWVKLFLIGVNVAPTPAADERQQHVDPENVRAHQNAGRRVRGSARAAVDDEDSNDGGLMSADDRVHISSDDGKPKAPPGEHSVQLCILSPTSLRGKSFTITESGATIGAMPEATIVFQDDARSVSRKHARVTFNSGYNRFFITDLSSLNGTSVTTDTGTIRLIPHKPFVLKPGFLISIGAASLQLAVGTAVVPPNSVPKDTTKAVAEYLQSLKHSSSQPPKKLLVLKGMFPGAIQDMVFEVNIGGATIGALSSNTIHIQDDGRTISRNHADITYDDTKGFVLTDLDSANGTTVTRMGIAQRLMPGIQIVLESGVIVQFGAEWQFVVSKSNDRPPNSREKKRGGKKPRNRETVAVDNDKPLIDLAAGAPPPSYDKKDEPPLSETLPMPRSPALIMLDDDEDEDNLKVNNRQSLKRRSGKEEAPDPPFAKDNGELTQPHEDLTIPPPPRGSTRPSSSRPAATSTSANLDKRRERRQTRVVNGPGASGSATRPVESRDNKDSDGSFDGDWGELKVAGQAL